MKNETLDYLVSRASDALRLLPEDLMVNGKGELFAYEANGAKTVQLEPMALCEMFMEVRAVLTELQTEIRNEPRRTRTASNEEPT